jgi:hypothetical protein
MGGGELVEGPKWVPDTKIDWPKNFLSVWKERIVSIFSIKTYAKHASQVVRFRELLPAYKTLSLLWFSNLPRVRRVFGAETLPFSCKVAGSVCLYGNARRDIRHNGGEDFLLRAKRAVLLSREVYLQCSGQQWHWTSISRRKQAVMCHVRIYLPTALQASSVRFSCGYHGTRNNNKWHSS